MPLLSNLLAEMPIAANVEGDVAGVISDITTDSRAAHKGSMFVAIRGAKMDGHDYIAEAIKNGAEVIVMARDCGIEIDAGLTAISVDNTREALAHLAAAFYGTQPSNVVAVTGTDGKTSTVDFARQLATLHGVKSASIGTLGVKCEDTDIMQQFAATHTSPDPLKLHALLKQLAQARISDVAIEASSHGLDQFRLDGVNLKAAAFTNFTRDHLDYHLTIDAYFAAKSRLFSELLPKGALAILNADDDRFLPLQEMCRKRNHTIISYGRNGVTLKIDAVKSHALGLDAQVIVEGKAIRLTIPMYGEFQLYNMLAAVGLSHAFGMGLEESLVHCAQLKNVAGRMELVAQHNRGAAIFIDYAHTPAALQKLLEVTRQHITGKLVVVFGCGGDRDKGKRPLMGAIAKRLADVVVVTDDNPRSENPSDIRAEIMAQCANAIEIGDRKQAIIAGLKTLEKNDALIVAGKGHETTQIIGEQILHFNDAEIIREAVARL